MKTEDLVVGNNRKGGQNSTANVDEDAKMQQVALLKYCRIFDVQIQDLVDSQDLDGAALKIKVDFVLTDRPCSIRRGLGRPILSISTYSQRGI